MATHAGITTDEFAATVAGWLATARHPRFQRLYTQLVYQPMLELLAYLHANGFTSGSCHDNAEREYAYDRDSHIGRLDKALDAAPSAGWTVVSMKSDWKQVFPEIE